MSTFSKAAARALEFVDDGAAIGLGTGRAAASFVNALGARVKAGLRIRAVPTSETTAELARALGIPLTTLAETEELDLTVDGADEVDPQLNLIKGYGGALVREKIVAASSRRLVILVGSEKRVAVLGARGKLPVEVVPFGAAFCRRRLAGLGCRPSLRVTDGRVFVTDNGNHILDCGIDPISDPAAFERALLDIPGVVGTGLFVGMADAVVIEDGGSVEVRRRPSP
jgi:ribose 5-phosphate isomerase A